MNGSSWSSAEEDGEAVAENDLFGLVGLEVVQRRDGDLLPGLRGRDDVAVGGSGLGVLCA